MWTKEEDLRLLELAKWAHPNQMQTASLFFQGKFDRYQLEERLKQLTGGTTGRQEEEEGEEDPRLVLFKTRLARINANPSTHEAKWRRNLRLPPLPPPQKPPPTSFQAKPQNSVFNTEEKKLERKLGPPGEEDADDGSSITRHIKKEPKDKSILSLAGKHFSPSSTKTTSHQRTAPGPVVGWPPVRSFRKNLASGGSSSKLGNDSTNSNGVVLKNQQCDDDVKTMEPKRQGGMFVNINMCGSSCYGAGIVNLGNTCYMNSTVQCLKSVPELRSALSKSVYLNDVDPTSHMLTVATRELFGELDTSVNAVSPTQFWMVLRKKYPQFNQLQNGIHMQQDAEECWTQLLHTLSQSLKAPTPSEDPDAVKALFGFNLWSRLHCQESGDESTETESAYSLRCYISHEVNHLHEGLKHGLNGELEKTSPALGRTALYLKESLIDSLPRYLTVQFVRFFWKRETNQKAKILRRVDYPLELDIFDLCSEDLRKKLEAPRQKLRDEEAKKLGLQTSAKSSSKDSDVKTTDAETSSNGGNGESSTANQREGSSSEKETHMTGIYDLVAVLTHKGRSADSGHYVAWVKQENGLWIQYDDENRSIRTEEDILLLSGGGDTADTAYIVMYKERSFTALKK